MLDTQEGPAHTNSFHWATLVSLAGCFWLVGLSFLLYGLLVNTSFNTVYLRLAIWLVLFQGTVAFGIYAMVRSERPRWRKGHGLTIVCVIFQFLITLVMGILNTGL